MIKIIFLLLLPLNIYAQNTLSLILQPVDRGVGIKYDHYFKGTGIYLSGAYGNYKTNDDYIKDHIRVAGGISAIIESAKVSFGMVYHKYGEIHGEFTDITTDPVSFELGVGTFKKWFNIGIRFDIIKYESCIDIGVNF
jgi:hypothetical protein